MKFSRAFSYIFDDRYWQSKLGISFAITAAATLLTPFLVGFVLWAVLLGYQSQLVYNWRNEVVHPLPRWSGYGHYLNNGAQILTAIFVYNVPNLLLGVCIWTLIAAASGTEYTSMGVTVGVVFCLFPLLLVYNCVIWSMLALGIARFQDSRDIGAFFAFGNLLRTIRARTELTLQYLLMLMGANLIMVLLMILPIIGWVIVPAILIPVQGALIGQYTTYLAGKPKATGFIKAR